MVSTMALVWTVIDRAERQSARMSKITNDGVTPVDVTGRVLKFSLS